MLILFIVTKISQHATTGLCALQFRRDQDNIVREMVTFTNLVIFGNISDNRWDVRRLTAQADLLKTFQNLNGLSQYTTRAIGG